MLITIHHSTVHSLRKKSAKYKAAILACWLLLLRHMILRCISPLLKQASFHSPEATKERRGCEIAASEQLNTCQSDLQWQATLLLPTLITQINIKLNTRPCSVNFYVVKNDWLFASLHQRDQSTRERYQTASLPLEIPLCSFYLPCIYNCQCSLSALPATPMDMSHTILCDMYLICLGKVLQWDCLTK